MKRCSGCKEEKPKSAFGKNKATKDGLHCYCLECARKKDKHRTNKTVQEGIGLQRHQIRCYNAPNCKETMVVFTEPGETPDPRTCPVCREMGQPSERFQWRGI